MAARRASDILASLRLSSLMSLVPALFLRRAPSPRARFSALSLFVLYICIYIEFYIPGLHLILFRVKLFTLFHTTLVDAGASASLLAHRSLAIPRLFCAIVRTLCLDYRSRGI